MTANRRWPWAALLLVLACGGAVAQDRGTLNPKPLPPLANPDNPSTPAKELFARRTEPAAMQPRTIGFYSHGCLAGGCALQSGLSLGQRMRMWK